MIVASGPSTASVDLSLIAGLRCIAVSHGCRAVRDADALLFGGQSFAQNRAWVPYRGPLIVMGNRPFPATSGERRMVYMPRAGAFGLSVDPATLCGAESSVTLAINYAVHRGASRLILLGCDGKPGPNGERRIGGRDLDTRDALRRYADQERVMRSQIEPLAVRGVGIVNCSPGTALACYPRADLRDAIAAC